MSIITDSEGADRLLAALAEQLAAEGQSYELVVIGGSALIALGTISRATADIDVLAFRDGENLVKASPFPTPLLTACERVGRDFGVPADWLNPGPADLLDFGLPEGFSGRLTQRTYSAALTVWFASRMDQIHFKLYALVDQGPGKHETDLRTLDPTPNELVRAARWTRTHDPSEGFEQLLREALCHLGVKDADLSA